MSAEEWQRRARLVEELKSMLRDGSLCVRHEEGDDQTAFTAELLPNGEIVIWTE